MTQQLISAFIQCELFKKAVSLKEGPIMSLL